MKLTASAFTTEAGIAASRHRSLPITNAALTTPIRSFEKGSSGLIGHRFLHTVAHDVSNFMGKRPPYLGGRMRTHVYFPYESVARSNYREG